MSQKAINQFTFYDLNKALVCDGSLRDILFDADRGPYVSVLSCISANFDVIDISTSDNDGSRDPMQCLNHIANADYPASLGLLIGGVEVRMYFNSMDEIELDFRPEEVTQDRCEPFMTGLHTIALCIGTPLTIYESDMSSRRAQPVLVVHCNKPQVSILVE